MSKSKHFWGILNPSCAKEELPSLAETVTNKKTGEQGWENAIEMDSNVPMNSTERSHRPYDGGIPTIKNLCDSNGCTRKVLAGRPGNQPAKPCCGWGGCTEGDMFVWKTHFHKHITNKKSRWLVLGRIVCGSEIPNFRPQRQSARPPKRG